MPQHGGVSELPCEEKSNTERPYSSDCTHSEDEAIHSSRLKTGDGDTQVAVESETWTEGPCTELLAVLPPNYGNGLVNLHR